MYKTSVDTYKSFLYKYGILIVLIILEDFQEKEYYEECDKIIKAIEREEKLHNQKLPTRLTDKTIDFILNENQKCNFTLNQRPDYMLYAVQSLLCEIQGV